ncbi:AAA family ATPase [Chitinophaga sp. 212800010-3]|uniref:AAA family ATPase n=1 Tax=unclassified Chitinophaga TaxID=2619133 RepID=UPI002DE68DD8|nr:Dephospho-CoA kinase [Chitinophaga sp. 212800010-3]
MKTILITGMSGTGKSTVVRQLLANGFNATDLDAAPYSMWVDADPDPEYPDNEVQPGKDWVWNGERIASLLSGNKGLLFVSGCASNMVAFYPQFDHIILLTAPDEVMINRLQTRSDNTYGNQAEERTRVLYLKSEIEPLLREAADLEIDTDMPAETVMDAILQHVGAR